ncbi:MAG: hypothetical protein ABEN55_02335 [Bradymonadaceae bacterium]
MILIGSILGLAINVGAVYYFANFTRRQEKSSALSVILSVVLGPLVGYAYARPKAWSIGLIAELLFFTPAGIGAGLLIRQGSVAIGGILAAYLVVSAAVTAVFMTQDQNDQFGDRQSLA